MHMQMAEAQRNQAVEEGNMFDKGRLTGMRIAGRKLHSKERKEIALGQSVYLLVMQHEYCPTAIKADVPVNCNLPLPALP